MNLDLWQLQRLQRGITKARIIDKSGEGVFNSQADGFHPRAMEILHSFGIAQWLYENGSPFTEFCVWVCF